MYKFTALIILLSLSSCFDFLTNSNDDKKPDKPTSTEFTLEVGDTQTLPNGSIIKFVDILEDSRCPIDVECVWEGNFKIQLEIDSKTMLLNTNLEPKAIDINGTKISIKKVLPEADSKKKIEKHEYEVLFKVE